MRELLRLIGLNNNSSKLYQSLIKEGALTMSELSDKTNLIRSSCYTFIKPLFKKGLVSKCISDGKTFYFAENPNKILKILKEEKNQIELKFNIGTNLFKEYQYEFNKLRKYKRPKVRYFEGERGLQEAYEDTLQSSEAIRAYANIEEMHKGLPHFFPEYYKRRSNTEIFIHTIAPDNQTSIERSKHDNKEFREIRFIDKDKYEFTPEINIYDNKILFASWKEKIAIVIESEEIADFHKKIFDVLYEKLKKRS
jgi:sugar-specific transcriptional regulator TrmB